MPDTTAVPSRDPSQMPMIPLPPSQRLETKATVMTNVGVVGLGVVGGTIARAFTEAAVPVRRYDLYQGIGGSEDLAECSVIFLCLPTPASPEGGYDVTEVWNAVRSLVPHLREGTVMALKSTVPPGTGDALAEAFPTFEFASVPEFLVADRPDETFLHPDRLIIGCDSPEAASLLHETLRRVVPDAPVVMLTRREAELAKLCSNAMLAAKVTLANELFEVCSRFGVDWSRIQDAVGQDRRIGRGHLDVTAERGFGGTCLPKDLYGLIGSSTRAGYAPMVLMEIARFNEWIRREAEIPLRLVASEGHARRA
jgi:UDPglucose 6-dehydrogenase